MEKHPSEDQFFQALDSRMSEENAASLSGREALYRVARFKGLEDGQTSIEDISSYIFSRIGQDILRYMGTSYLSRSTIGDLPSSLAHRKSTKSVLEALLEIVERIKDDRSQSAVIRRAVSFLENASELGTDPYRNGSRDYYRAGLRFVMEGVLSQITNYLLKAESVKDFYSRIIRIVQDDTLIEEFSQYARVNEHVDRVEAGQKEALNNLLLREEINGPELSDSLIKMLSWCNRLETAPHHLSVFIARIFIEPMLTALYASLQSGSALNITLLTLPESHLRDNDCILHSVSAVYKTSKKTEASQIVKVEAEPLTFVYKNLAFFSINASYVWFDTIEESILAENSSRSQSISQVKIEENLLTQIITGFNLLGTNTSRSCTPYLIKGNHTRFSRKRREEKVREFLRSKSPRNEGIQSFDNKIENNDYKEEALFTLQESTYSLLENSNILPLGATKLYTSLLSAMLYSMGVESTEEGVGNQRLLYTLSYCYAYQALYRRHTIENGIDDETTPLLNITCPNANFTSSRYKTCHHNVMPFHFELVPKEGNQQTREEELRTPIGRYASGKYILEPNNLNLPSEIAHKGEITTASISPYPLGRLRTLPSHNPNGNLNSHQLQSHDIKNEEIGHFYNLTNISSQYFATPLYYKRAITKSERDREAKDRHMSIMPDTGLPSQTASFIEWFLQIREHNNITPEDTRFITACVKNPLSLFTYSHNRVQQIIQTGIVPAKAGEESCYANDYNFYFPGSLQKAGASPDKYSYLNQSRDLINTLLTADIPNWICQEGSITITPPKKKEEEPDVPVPLFYDGLLNVKRILFTFTEDTEAQRQDFYVLHLDNLSKLLSYNITSRQVSPLSGTRTTLEKGRHLPYLEVRDTKAHQSFYTSGEIVGFYEPSMDEVKASNKKLGVDSNEIQKHIELRALNYIAFLYQDILVWKNVLLRPTTEISSGRRERPQRYTNQSNLFSCLAGTPYNQTKTQTSYVEMMPFCILGNHSTGLFNPSGSTKQYVCINKLFLNDLKEESKQVFLAIKPHSLWYPISKDHNVKVNDLISSGLFYVVEAEVFINELSNQQVSIKELFSELLVSYTKHLWFDQQNYFLDNINSNYKTSGEKEEGIHQYTTPSTHLFSRLRYSRYTSSLSLKQDYPFYLYETDVDTLVIFEPCTQPRKVIGDYLKGILQESHSNIENRQQYSHNLEEVLENRVYTPLRIHKKGFVREEDMYKAFPSLVSFNLSFSSVELVRRSSLYEEIPLQIISLEKFEELQQNLSGDDAAVRHNIHYGSLYVNNEETLAVRHPTDGYESSSVLSFPDLDVCTRNYRRHSSLFAAACDTAYWNSIFQFDTTKHTSLQNTETIKQLVDNFYNRAKNKVSRLAFSKDDNDFSYYRTNAIGEIAREYLDRPMALLSNKKLHYRNSRESTRSTTAIQKLLQVSFIHRVAATENPKIPSGVSEEIHSSYVNIRTIFSVSVFTQAFLIHLVQAYREGHTEYSSDEELFNALNHSLERIKEAGENSPKDKYVENNLSYLGIEPVKYESLKRSFKGSIPRKYEPVIQFLNRDRMKRIFHAYQDAPSAIINQQMQRHSIAYQIDTEGNISLENPQYEKECILDRLSTQELYPTEPQNQENLIPEGSILATQGLRGLLAMQVIVPVGWEELPSLAQLYQLKDHLNRLIHEADTPYLTEADPTTNRLLITPGADGPSFNEASLVGGRRGLRRPPAIALSNISSEEEVTNRYHGGPTGNVCYDTKMLRKHLVILRGMIVSSIPDFIKEEGAESLIKRVERRSSFIERIRSHKAEYDRALHEAFISLSSTVERTKWNSIRKPVVNETTSVFVNTDVIGELSNYMSRISNRDISLISVKAKQLQDGSYRLPSHSIDKVYEIERTLTEFIDNVPNMTPALRSLFIREHQPITFSDSLFNSRTQPNHRYKSKDFLHLAQNISTNLFTFTYGPTGGLRVASLSILKLNNPRTRRRPTTFDTGGDNFVTLNASRLYTQFIEHSFSPASRYVMLFNQEAPNLNFNGSFQRLLSSFYNGDGVYQHRAQTPVDLRSHIESFGEHQNVESVNPNMDRLYTPDRSARRGEDNIANISHVMEPVAQEGKKSHVITLPYFFRLEYYLPYQQQTMPQLWSRIQNAIPGQREDVAYKAACLSESIRKIQSFYNYRSVWYISHQCEKTSEGTFKVEVRQDDLVKRALEERGLEHIPIEYVLPHAPHKSSCEGLDQNLLETLHILFSSDDARTAFQEISQHENPVEKLLFLCMCSSYEDLMGVLINTCERKIPESSLLSPNVSSSAQLFSYSVAQSQIYKALYGTFDPRDGNENHQRYNDSNNAMEFLEDLYQEEVSLPRKVCSYIDYEKMKEIKTIALATIIDRIAKMVIQLYCTDSIPKSDQLFSSSITKEEKIQRLSSIMNNKAAAEQSNTEHFTKHVHWFNDIDSSFKESLIQLTASYCVEYIEEYPSLYHSREESIALFDHIIVKVFDQGIDYSKNPATNIASRDYSNLIEMFAKAHCSHSTEENEQDVQFVQDIMNRIQGYKDPKVVLKHHTSEVLNLTEAQIQEVLKRFPYDWGAARGDQKPWYIDNILGFIRPAAEDSHERLEEEIYHVERVGQETGETSEGDQEMRIVNPNQVPPNLVRERFSVKKEYFITKDLAGYKYYKVQVECNEEGTHRFTRRPPVLADGYVVMPDRTIYEVTIEDIERGRILKTREVTPEQVSGGAINDANDNDTDECPAVLDITDEESEAADMAVQNQIEALYHSEDPETARWLQGITYTE